MLQLAVLVNDYADSFIRDVTLPVRAMQEQKKRSMDMIYGPRNREE